MSSLAGRLRSMGAGRPSSLSTVPAAPPTTDSTTFTPLLSTQTLLPGGGGAAAALDFGGTAQTVNTQNYVADTTLSVHENPNECDYIREFYTSVYNVKKLHEIQIADLDPAWHMQKADEKAWYLALFLLITPIIFTTVNIQAMIFLPGLMAELDEFYLSLLVDLTSAIAIRLSDDSAFLAHIHNAYNDFILIQRAVEHKLLTVILQKNNIDQNRKLIFGKLYRDLYDYLPKRKINPSGPLDFVVQMLSLLRIRDVTGLRQSIMNKSRHHVAHPVGRSNRPLYVHPSNVSFFGNPPAGPAPTPSNPLPPPQPQQSGNTTTSVHQQPTVEEAAGEWEDVEEGEDLMETE